jgi:hypothetical protein
MRIENGIADGVDFFHMDALSSAVAMKVSCDLQLTMMASSLYRLLGERIGNGYDRQVSAHLPRLHQRSRERDDQRAGHHGAFPETRPQPLADGRRLRADRSAGAVAGQEEAAARLRLDIDEGVPEDAE